MPRIALASFGKPDPALAREVGVYADRLQTLVGCECVQLKESKRSDSEGRLKEEAEAFTRKFPASQWQWVLLSEEGKLWTTEQFASWLDQNNTKPIVFLIGSAYGLDTTLKTQAQLLWSLSPLTFTHEHARLILTEQVYRAVQVLRGHPYHHR